MLVAEMEVGRICDHAKEFQGEVIVLAPLHNFFPGHGFGL